MLEFEFSSHGAGMIHAYRWEPEGQPRGVVQIIHGIAEYVPRYAGFAAFLNAHGLLVTGEDHMGHGKSHGTEPCHFSGGWCAAVDDSMELLRRTQRDYPGVPYFVLGHSMGSFLTRTLLFRYPDAGLRAAVICGTGWQPAPVLAAGLALCGLPRQRRCSRRPWQRRPQRPPARPWRPQRLPRQPSARLRPLPVPSWLPQRPSGRLPQPMPSVPHTAPRQRAAFHSS